MAKIKKNKKPVEVEPLFSRGYDEVRRRLNKKSIYTMSCYNCEHYYQLNGDKEELCQNSEVLSFDLVKTKTSVFCTRWKLVQRTETAKELFKKGKK